MSDRAPFRGLQSCNKSRYLRKLRKNGCNESSCKGTVGSQMVYISTMWLSIINNRRVLPLLTLYIAGQGSGIICQSTYIIYSCACSTHMFRPMGVTSSENEFIEIPLARSLRWLTTLSHCVSGSSNNTTETNKKQLCSGSIDRAVCMAGRESRNNDSSVK